MSTPKTPEQKARARYARICEENFKRFKDCQSLDEINARLKFYEAGKSEQKMYASFDAEKQNEEAVNRAYVDGYRQGVIRNLKSLAAKLTQAQWTRWVNTALKADPEEEEAVPRSCVVAEDAEGNAFTGAL